MSCQGCLFKRDYPDALSCSHPDGPDIDGYLTCQNKYDILEAAELAAAAERFRP